MAYTDVAIFAHNLHKKLGINLALQGISLSFQTGIMHGVIGPEGAGKTTLLRILLGLLSPNQGSVEYQSAGTSVPFADIRPDLAYMPQQQSLYPDLSISEHLDFFRALYQIPHDIYKQKRAELLQITRLEPFQDRSARQLSGGMYKKLGLMCALLRSPSVMLLDEPTNGVDPISRREFWELLYHLAEQKILVIITTAYMDEAERCGQVHLLQEGQLLAEGEPRELLQKEHAGSFDEIFMKMQKKEIARG